MKKASTALTATSPFGTSPTIAGGVYDMYFMDVQMFTVLNIGNAVTPYTAGVRITGKTSGASGFIADTGNNTHYIYLEQVDGVFSNGEILEINGRNVGTLEAAHSYQLTDVRSAFGLTSTQTVRFGCNWVLNDSRAIEVSTVDIDDTTDDEITGFRTRFEKDLRPGDVVTAVISDLEGNNTHRILRVDPTAIGVTTANKKNSVANSAVIFDYADQTAKIDGSLKVGTIADGQYSELVRLRPFIFQKDYQNGELSFDLPEDVMKSLDDESFFVYRNFASKTVTTGSITFTLPESESFGALSGDNYILTIINNGGSGICKW